MEHWNVATCDPEKNEGASLFLMNRSRTLVSVHRRLRFDPITLFKKMERLRFPLRYTNGLERIHFTVLTGDAVGYYMDNKIWVDVSQAHLWRHVPVFIHEVGHHVEDKEGIAEFLHEERMKKAKFLKEQFSSRTDDEYLALGFEKYYAEDAAHRRRLRQRNPLLYRTIQMLNREYRRKG